ncbi:MAG: hypothetical protein IJN13_05100 [Bacilli bacterium]|nr:hypothetical protein [Bacilli bacterium]
MIYYPNNNYKVQPLNNNNNRFILPFLGGALIGGAAVGLTRPRPIYNVAPYPYPPYGGPIPYGYNNYNYYYPPYRPY